MPTARGSKGPSLDDLVVDEDKLTIKYSCNGTAEQTATGLYKGMLKVGDDRCIVVLTTDGKPYEAIPIRWFRIVQRTVQPEIISFT